MSKQSNKSSFWKTFILATEADFRDVPGNTITGASGFSHPVVALGVDDVRRRVVLISGEGDARSAALAQGDIQAVMSDVRVVMARPSPVNLGAAARMLSDLIGSARIGQKQMALFSKDNSEDQQATMNQFLEMIHPFTFGPFANASLNILAAWKDVVHQLALVEIEAEAKGNVESEPGGSTGQSPLALDIKQLAAFDPVAIDRSLGVCAIPLYDFEESDYDVFQSGKDIEAAKNILQRNGILQYFFPPADQLALGMVDNEGLNATQVMERVVNTPAIGHPFGPLELVDPATSLRDVIQAIQDKGLVVDSGEYGIEVTADGTSVRSSVKFSPREGLLAKISRIFSVKLDISLKNLF